MKDPKEPERTVFPPAYGSALTRRRFLGLAAGLGAAGATGLQAACGQTKGEREEPSVEGKSTPLVVRVQRPGNGERAPDREQAGVLMDRVLAPLGNGKDASSALRRLFRGKDRIGIKVNCLAGRGLSPTPVLVEALVRRFREAGWPPSKIVVFERTERELRRAGFPGKHGAPRRTDTLPFGLTGKEA